LILLSEVFLPQFIKVNLDADNKEEVFEEMVDHFCSVTGNPGRENILAALREREAKMSTGVHPGIAIPHGKTDAVDKSYGVLGVSQKGIDYDSLDGKPVYVVFMELAPILENQHHLHLLKEIAEVLRNNEFYEAVRKVTTSEAAYEVLKKYEDTNE
jgi:PTS system fructose-specific IIC component/PTS system nitrogen regulatory IIA component